MNLFCSALKESLMETDEFIQRVQATLLDGKGRVTTRGDVWQAVAAILVTLSEVLQPKKSRELAAALPADIGVYLSSSAVNRHESLTEFFYFVGLREGITLPYAIHHSRTVIAVLKVAVSVELMQTVQEQVPHEFAPLFQ